MIYASLSGLLFSFYWWNRLGTPINPVTLFLLGISFPILFAISFVIKFSPESILNWNDLDYSNNVIGELSVGYFLTIIVFQIPWFFVKKAKNKPAAKETRETTLLPIALICLSLLLVCSMFLEGLPIIQMALGTLDMRSHDANLINIPFGLLTFLNIFIFLYIITFTNTLIPSDGITINRAKLIYLLLLLLLCFWQGKRQHFLIFLFFYIARYYIVRIEYLGHRFNHKAIFKSLIFSILLIVAFIIIDQIRYQGDGSNTLILFGYFTWPVYNLLSIVELYRIGPPDIGLMFITELIPNRFGGEEKVVEYSRYLFEPSSPSGYLAYWWFDGGLWFALFGVLVLSYASRFSYSYFHASRTNKSLSIYLLLLWCCASSGIYNHFISLNFFWLPLVMLLLIFRQNRKIVTRRGFL